MKISKAIERLETIKKAYGDLVIVGGYMVDDRELKHIEVINENGVSIYDDPNNEIEGVFLS